MIPLDIYPSCSLGCRGEALTQSRSDSGVYTGLPLQASSAMIFVRFLALHVQQLHHVFAVRSPLKRLRNQDRMCKCNTVTRDDIPFAIWSELRPDTPYQCVRAQCGFLFSSASSPTRSLTFGRWGCGERCHLSHAVGDSAVVLSGMSRQIALQTRSEALRRTRRGLNARQGMEGAKTLTERFRRSGAPIPLARGFQVARNRASPLQSPFARYKQPLVGRWS